MINEKNAIPGAQIRNSNKKFEMNVSILTLLGKPPSYVLHKNVNYRETAYFKPCSYFKPLPSAFSHVPKRSVAHRLYLFLATVCSTCAVSRYYAIATVLSQ